MAFSVLLQRSTSAAAPLFARSIKPAPKLLRNILPLSRLSSLSEKRQHSESYLLNVLDSEIKFASDDYKKPEKFPSGFPFDIEDEKGTSAIVLRRKYGNEEMEVVVSMPSIVNGENDDGDEEKDDDDDDDDDGEGEEDEGMGQFCIPLTVNIEKGGRCLEFGCTAYPDEIEIDSMLLRADRVYEGEMAPYEGPPFK